MFEYRISYHIYINIVIVGVYNLKEENVGQTFNSYINYNHKAKTGGRTLANHCQDQFISKPVHLSCGCGALGNVPGFEGLQG